MQYMLLLYVDSAVFIKMTPEEQSRGLAAYTAFTEALKKAGAYLSSGRLQPTSAATTVRVRTRKPRCSTDPTSRPRNNWAAISSSTSPDLDAALSWAARCPAASHGIVEVRPIWVM
jgi:hypothetical protein